MSGFKSAVAFTLQDWYSKITNTNTPASQFLKAVGVEMVRNAKKANKCFTPADELAAACLINDKLALETQDVVRSITMMMMMVVVVVVVVMMMFPIDLICICTNCYWFNYLIQCITVQVCDVELAGFKTRGQMVIDWKSNGAKRVKIIKKLDVEQFKTMMEQCLDN